MDPSSPPSPLKGPITVKLKAGVVYRYCRCGHTQHQPFCDQTSKDRCSPLTFSVSRDQTVWLCGCRLSRTPPYCNGAHRTLGSFFPPNSNQQG